MKGNHIYEIICKYLADEISEKEKLKVQRWFNGMVPFWMIFEYGSKKSFYLIHPKKILDGITGPPWCDFIVGFKGSATHQNRNPEINTMYCRSGPGMDMI